VVDFIEEVEEQLRSDRYRALALRLAPWFVAALVALVAGWLGVWGWQTLQARNVGKASAAYDKALASLGQNDETGAFTALDPVAKSGPAGYKTLALIQQGDMRLGAGKTDEAVAFFDKAAATAPNPIFGDLARLKAALALMDTAPYPQIQTRLSPLIGDAKPFSLNAREALAFAKLKAGKTDDARRDFVVLGLIADASEAMRARAQAAISLIDSGQAKVAVQAAELAATLPPPGQGNVGAPPDGAPPPQSPDNAQAGPAQ
jgi:hypothetical protein